MADLWRDFWIHETGTGQQVAQLHDRYMMMMMCEFLLNDVDSSNMQNSLWATGKCINFINCFTERCNAHCQYICTIIPLWEN